MCIQYIYVLYGLHMYGVRVLYVRTYTYYKGYVQCACIVRMYACTYSCT